MSLKLNIKKDIDTKYLKHGLKNYNNIEDLLNVFSGSCLSLRSFLSNFTIITLTWRNFILQRKAFE